MFDFADKFMAEELVPHHCKKNTIQACKVFDMPHQELSYNVIKVFWYQRELPIFTSMFEV